MGNALLTDLKRLLPKGAVSADPELEAIVVPRTLVTEVFGHARECYPEECCGIVTGPAEGQFREVVRCTNMQDLRYSKGESELDARHGFWIDEQELLAALRSAEQQGDRLLMIYHSHVDSAAYLSQADLACTLDAAGTPLWPGVDLLVVSVHEDGVQAASLFAWDAQRGSFSGRGVREAD